MLDANKIACPLFMPFLTSDLPQNIKAARQFQPDMDGFFMIKTFVVRVAH